MINFDDLTIKQVKELQHLLRTNNDSSVVSSHFEIGKVYFIRTVSMHHIGKIESILDQELLLSGASWIADSGRFHDALAKGKLNEVEPFVNNVIIGRGTIVDASEWTHDIPKKQL